jgi:hypothetical protein
MNIIPNWRRAWRMFSVQLASILVVWAATPAETQAAVMQVVGIRPDQMTGILGLLIIIGRLVEQPKTR